MNKQILDASQQLGFALKSRGLSITTAESCTGGGVAHAITEIAGCSQWFECSFVTYSNFCKQQLLGVLPELIESEGAVSEAVVCSMAKGAIKKVDADVAIAVSGIAGPGGAIHNKPVGTVWIAWAFAPDTVEASLYHFNGDRSSIRQQAVYKALTGMLHRLK